MALGRSAIRVPISPTANPLVADTIRSGEVAMPATVPLRSVPGRPVAYGSGGEGITIPPAANVAAPAVRSVPNDNNIFIPIAEAQGAYTETGDPWSAAAQGFSHVMAQREVVARNTALRQTAADDLGKYPDLQRWVLNDLIDPDKALAEAARRDELAKGETTAADEKERIYQYLLDSDPDLADQWKAGVLTRDELSAEINKREAGPETNKISADIAAREEAGRRMGLDGEALRSYSLTGDIPKGDAHSEAATAEAARDAQVVVDDIDRAMDIINVNPWGTTGIIGEWTKGVPGMPAHDAASLITTVKANAAFDKLQRMREASPTGGALGSVSDKEVAYLQSVIGNLEQSQTSEQLIDNLKRVKNAYLDIVHGEGKGPPRENLSFTEVDESGGAAATGKDLPTIAGDDDYDALPSGAEFIDPEGNRRKKP